MSFGFDGPASYNADGFFTGLTAGGALFEGRARLSVYTRDHEPPHVHAVIPGKDDFRVNLETGELMDAPPKGTSSKSLKTIGRNIEEVSDTLDRWWLKNNTTPVARRRT